MVFPDWAIETRHAGCYPLTFDTCRRIKTSKKQVVFEPLPRANGSEIDETSRDLFGHPWDFGIVQL